MFSGGIEREMHEIINSMKCVKGYLWKLFKSATSFYTLWKHEKTFGFLMFSGEYRKRPIA